MRDHFRLFRLACMVFLANQLAEYLLLLYTNSSYSQLCNWDCGWYVGIFERGYDPIPQSHPRGDAANWAFFPAFPLLSGSVADVSELPIQLALVLTSKAFLLGAIFAFMKLVQSYYPSVPPLLAGCVVAFNPYSLYGNVGYTESMFLFFSCISLYQLRTQRYISGGLAGAVLSAVRPVGVFMSVSYFVAGMRSFAAAQAEDRLRMTLGMMLVPLGLAAFMIYLYWLMGDALAFSHVQIAWRRVPQYPWIHLISGIWGGLLIRLSTIMSIMALLMIVVLGLRKHYELAAFSLFATLIPLSTGLSAMPRYIWWQAPLLLLLAELLSHRRLWLLFFPLSLCGFVFVYLAWFGGQAWVI